MRGQEFSKSASPRLSRREVLRGAAGLAGAIVVLPGASWAQETPNEGGTLRIAQGADVQPKNILAGRAGNNPVRHNVFDTVAYLDSETGKAKAQLATGWESSADGKTFVVRLRDDVKFHTGRPMTAEDVVFTLEQVKLPENSSQMRPLVQAYTSIRATGSHEVTITSESPIAPRIFDVFQMAVIVDKDTFSGLADGSQVIGTGPFKWDGWEPGASLRMVKNADYWGEGPYLDAIELSVITDSTAMANAVRGRVDLVLGITPRDSIMFKGDPNLELFSSPGGGFYPLGLDVTAAPFDKKELRQAIGYAIDRQRIIDQIFNGNGETADVWWRSNEIGMTSEIAHHYSYDPDKARALIKAAGAEGAEVPITVIGLEPVPSIYEIVQNNLREVGLNPVGQVVETAKFDQSQTAGDLGPAFMQTHGLQGFSAATLVDALPALRPNNPSKMNDPKYRELKDKLQAAQAPEAYGAALRELAEWMLDQAFSHVMVKTSGLNVKTPMLKGIVEDNVGYQHFGAAWMAS